MAGERFTQKGTSKAYFLPAVATPATGPTSGEITAGTVLTGEFMDAGNWDFKSNPIKTPNWADTFTPSIPGEDTVDNPEMVLYDRNNVVTIKHALAKGTIGYIVWAVYGTGTGKECEVWHVEVAANSRMFSVGNDPARYKVAFTVLDPPVQNATMP